MEGRNALFRLTSINLTLKTFKWQLQDCGTAGEERMQHTVAICQEDMSSVYQPGLTWHHL